MLHLLSLDITTDACKWISMNPSYILWPGLLGLIALVFSLYYALKNRKFKAKTDAEFKGLSDKLNAQSALMTKLKNEKESQAIKCQEYKSELETKKSQMASLSTDIRNKSQQIDALQTTISQKEARLLEVERNLASTREQLVSLQQRLDAANQNLQQLQEEKQTIIGTIEEKELKINSLTEVIDTKISETAALEKQLDEKGKEFTSLQALLLEKDKMIEQSNEQIEQLKKQLQDICAAPEPQSDAQEPEEPESQEPACNEMNYNERNKNARDELIQFDSESHTYTLNGTVFKSVTTIVDECFQQFDADYWARKKAPSLGMTPEQVKAMWERKGEETRNLGTQMHEKIERYYLGLPNTSDDTYNLFCQFAQQHQLNPYRTEWVIYDEENKVAGTLDFLNYENGTFSIYDWKRSNKIIVNGQPEKVSRWDKRALPPITHIHDTTFWHYALQVSIYRYILEKNYDIKVSVGRLAIFHPEYNKPYVVEVPYMKDEVIKVLRKHR